ncbi:uncharacterized protein BJX67DRAFT_304029 [Aspergillus lucknowensis]|uniref:Uncharacterized protein n=1 Tax=Aspergillus lucknowensis TaxID=176173 RepID=A0ABR4M0X9_9EURO
MAEKKESLPEDTLKRRKEICGTAAPLVLNALRDAQESPEKMSTRTSPLSTPQSRKWAQWTDEERTKLWQLRQGHSHLSWNQFYESPHLRHSNHSSRVEPEKPYLRNTAKWTKRIDSGDARHKRAERTAAWLF